MSPVIPVRLEETVVPEILSKLQWVDLFENNGMNKLISALQKIVSLSFSKDTSNM